MKFLFTFIMGLILPLVLYSQPNNLNQLYQNINFVSDEFNNYLLDETKWDDWNAYSTSEEIYKKTSRLFVDGIQIDNINNSTNDPNGNDNIRWVSENGRNFLRIVTKYDDLVRKNPYHAWNDTSKPFENFFSSTAQIWSKQKMRYGYYEIMCRMPDNSSQISANFWLYNFQSCPGYSSEVDIFEHRTYFADEVNEVASNIHSAKRCCIGNVDASNHDCCADSYARPYNYTEYETELDLTQNFYTYGVEFKPGILEFYFNGNLIRTMTYLQATQHILEQPNVNSCLYEGNYVVELDYLKEMRVGIDVGLARYFTGPRPQPGIEQYYDVDYFRYYKRKPHFSSIPKINCNTAFVDVSVTPGTIDDSFQAITSTNAQWQNLGNNNFRIIPDGSGNPIELYVRFVDPYGIITENNMSIPVEQTNSLNIVGINSFCNYTNTSTFTLNQTNNTVDVAWSVTNGTIISSDNQSCTVQWNTDAQQNGAEIFAQLIGTTPECTNIISHPISSCCSSSDLTVYQNLEVPAKYSITHQQ